MTRYYAWFHEGQTQLLMVSNGYAIEILVFDDGEYIIDFGVAFDSYPDDNLIYDDLFRSAYHAAMSSKMKGGSDD